VDSLLRSPRARRLLDRYRREHVVGELRLLLEELRRVPETSSGGGAARSSRHGPGRVPAAAANDGDAAETAALGAGILERLEARLAALSLPRLSRVVNATGVVLHTNLGRALLAPEAIARVAEAAAHPVTLEYDLARGGRGERDAVVEADLAALTGAEAATVVTSNAAAVLLGLNALAEGRDVVVSRGELIEIGGGFRIPEIMTKSGARLREVGTTNRTHLEDYLSAIGPETALLLKVHTSNYRIVGFTAAVPLGELVRIGRERGLPVMADLGSGALLDLGAHGLREEPVVAAAVAAGADVVTFSGDKLLGGPQAGIVVGRREAIERIRRNPLRRATRPGKLEIAALEATLTLYRQSPDPVAAVPTLRFLARRVDDVERVGRAALPLLAERLGPEFEIALVESEAEVGSGALPGTRLPSYALAVRHPGRSPDDIARFFRAAEPPVLGRVSGGAFLLDLRTILAAEELLVRFP
jgi:L-seryl-tRNA(Ser) seleniumtransferase